VWVLSAECLSEPHMFSKLYMLFSPPPPSPMEAAGATVNRVTRSTDAVTVRSVLYEVIHPNLLEGPLVGEC